MAINKDQERAVELIGRAMQHQMAQEFDQAIALLRSGNAGKVVLVPWGESA